MTAADLRGGKKPSLSDALGWIGSRVDDVHGAAVGRLEDVWIDPGTGAPRWLLVERGGLGAGATLLPFEDAAGDGGRLWISYERDVVLSAPEIEAGSPLTQQAEAEAPRTAPLRAAPPPERAPGAPAAEPAPGAPAAEPAFAQAPAAPLSAFQEPTRTAPGGGYQPEPGPGPGLASPIERPPARERHGPAAAPYPGPSGGPPPLRPLSAPDRVPPAGGVAPGFSSYPPAPVQPEHEAEPGPPPRYGHAAANAAPGLGLGLEGPTTIEIRLEGELRITGELRGLRVTEVGEQAPGARRATGGEGTAP